MISSASKSLDLSQSRVGTVLVSAAVLDDISGLVMLSVIQRLGSIASGGHVNLGWLIGRPIVASFCMAILTPLLTKFAFAPVFRKYIETRLAVFGHSANIILTILVLCAFISIAAYTGTSILFGAFLAGLFLAYIPSNDTPGSLSDADQERGSTPGKQAPTFSQTFERYCADVQRYFLAPLFFASIGFAIPFLSLWTGKAIWRGIVYSLLMVLAKAVVGIWIPLWDLLTSMGKKSGEKSIAPRSDAPGTTAAQEETAAMTEAPKWSESVPSALLLGSAMVARGEIGLLIVQVGYNQTRYVSEAGFITAVWAIVLNTIVGPVAVGVLIKLRAEVIGSGPWGIEKRT